MSLITSSHELGRLVRQRRKSLAMSQRDLALASGVGERFIVELERGKETCELSRVLRVVRGLGLTVDIAAPSGRTEIGSAGPIEGYDLADDDTS